MGNFAENMRILASGGFIFILYIYPLLQFLGVSIEFNILSVTLISVCCYFVGMIFYIIALPYFVEKSFIIISMDDKYNSKLEKILSVIIYAIFMGRRRNIGVVIRLKKFLEEQWQNADLDIGKFRGRYILNTIDRLRITADEKFSSILYDIYSFFVFDTNLFTIIVSYVCLSLISLPLSAIYNIGIPMLISPKNKLAFVFFMASLIIMAIIFRRDALISLINYYDVAFMYMNTDDGKKRLLSILEIVRKYGPEYLEPYLMVG